MPDGILNLDKPRGPTSHDVVDRVRALTGVRRVGHTGTLDPLATGVLVVCVGRPATRVVEYLMAARKTYRARVRLGITTDTYDAWGHIAAEAPVEVSRGQIEAALTRFRGAIKQVPPMYSAIKHKGKPLHRLARQGIEVEREPRQVEIFRLELTAWEPPECTLEATCSPGTYVRALAHDLGQALGCGAHLAALTRLASGSFLLEDAITLEELARAVSEGRWPDLLHPVDEVLADRFPALHLDVDAARRLCSGQELRGLQIADRVVSPQANARAELVLSSRRRIEGRSRSNCGLQAADLACVYGPDGTFLALAAYDPADDVWRPRKVFRSPQG